MFDMELEPWIPGDIMTIGLMHSLLEEEDSSQEEEDEDKEYYSAYYML